MKSKSLNILVLVLLIACVGCCPKAKQAIEPSQVIVTSYPSSIGEAGVAVYLPEGYATSEEDYPVLYLLHGSGDDETGWMTKGCAKAILDSLITNELCKPSSDTSAFPTIPSRCHEAATKKKKSS